MLMGTIKVYNKELAKKLQRKGHFCYKTVPNEKMKGLVIYLFDDVGTIQRDIVQLAGNTYKG